MANKLDSKAKRDRLAGRNEPYWHKLILGGYIGYRVGIKSGAWKARYKTDEGQKYKSLTLPAHKPVNEYDTAVTEARKWFEALQGGAKPRAGTIGEAIDDYLEYIERKNGEASAKDARGRAKRYIRPEFDNKAIDKLTTPELRVWHYSFVPKRGADEKIRKAKNSANRNLNTFKAILNHAHENGLVASNGVWSRVKRFPDVNRAREEFLTPAQIKNLLSMTTGGFHDLVKAGALTGARYGEVCKLRVRNLDKKNSLLTI